MKDWPKHESQNSHEDGVQRGVALFADVTCVFLDGTLFINMRQNYPVIPKEEEMKQELQMMLCSGVFQMALLVLLLVRSLNNCVFNSPFSKEPSASLISSREICFLNRLSDMPRNGTVSRSRRNLIYSVSIWIQTFGLSGTVRPRGKSWRGMRHVLFVDALFAVQLLLGIFACAYLHMCIFAYVHICMCIFAVQLLLGIFRCNSIS